MITGACSDLGEAFCERLSKEGFRLILVDDCDEEMIQFMAKKYGKNNLSFQFDWKKKTEWK